MIREYFGDGSAWGVDISYLEERERLGTAGALSLLPERPQHPFFVMNGDLLTTVNFEQMLKYHRENQAFSTVCVREHSVTVPFGVIEFDDHRLIGIREKPTHKFFVNAGVYLLIPVCWIITGDEVVDMPTLIERTIARGNIGRVSVAGILDRCRPARRFCSAPPTNSRGFSDEYRPLLRELMSLDGRVALVTGGAGQSARRIGRAGRTGGRIRCRRYFRAGR